MSGMEPTILFHADSMLASGQRAANLNAMARMISPPAATTPRVRESFAVALVEQDTERVQIAVAGMKNVADL